MYVGEMIRKFARLILEHKDFEGMTKNDDLKKACEVMAAGGLILYPTDTIWGIGCDATNEQAVQKVYALKQRSDHKAMLVLIDSVAKLDRYVDEVPSIAWDLIEVADKPLTIIYSKGKNLAPSLLGEGVSAGRSSRLPPISVDFLLPLSSLRSTRRSRWGLIILWNIVKMTRQNRNRPTSLSWAKEDWSR